MDDSSSQTSQPLAAAASGVDRPVAPDTTGADKARVVSLYEKTKKIYPKAVDGLFVKWRWAFVWLTQIVFYGLPWLMWNDRQAVLFELISRRFYIFGLVLYP